MKIEILGSGCAKCKKLYETAKQAVAESGVTAEVEKIEDIKRIMDSGVLMTPALVIDGEVKVSGKIPSVEQIKALLK